MKKYLLPLALTALFACNDNQSTSDNPFNNLEDAFVNFDQDQGVTDAAPILDIAQIPDTSPLDESLQDQSLPDAASDMSAPDNYRLCVLHEFLGNPTTYPNQRQSRIRKSNAGLLLATNDQGQPRAIHFTRDQIVFDQVYQGPAPTPLADISFQDPVFYIVGSIFIGPNQDPWSGYLNAQGELQFQQSNPSPQQDALSTVIPFEQGVLEAGSYQGQAEVCQRNFAQEECHQIAPGHVNALATLPGWGTYAAGLDNTSAQLWFLNSDFELEQTKRFGGSGSQLYDVFLTSNNELCIAGVMQEANQEPQAYLARLDATNLEEIASHQEPGTFYGVVGDETSCVAVGENQDGALAIRLEDSSLVWKAQGAGELTSLVQDEAGIVAAGRLQNQDLMYEIKQDCE